MTIYKQAMGKTNENDFSLEKNLLEIQKIRKISTEEMIVVSEINGEDKEVSINDLIKRNSAAYVWGVSNNPNNRTYFNKLEREDIVFFAREGFIVKIAEVSIKFESKEFANNIWGSDKWELIYLLKKVSEVHFPVEIFNEIVGYERGAFFRGLSVVKKDYNGKDLLLELALTYPDYFFEKEVNK